VRGAIGIFFYVGVEVGLASIAVNYFNSQGMSTAKTLRSSFLSTGLARWSAACWALGL